MEQRKWLMKVTNEVLKQEGKKILRVNIRHIEKKEEFIAFYAVSKHSNRGDNERQTTQAAQQVKAFDFLIFPRLHRRQLEEGTNIQVSMCIRNRHQIRKYTRRFASSKKIISSIFLS